MVSFTFDPFFNKLQQSSSLLLLLLPIWRGVLPEYMAVQTFMAGDNSMCCTGTETMMLDIPASGLWIPQMPRKLWSKTLGTQNGLCKLQSSVSHMSAVELLSTLLTYQLYVRGLSKENANGALPGVVQVLL